MAQECCVICKMPQRVINGPRNARFYTMVCSDRCRVRGLLALAEEDMLSVIEADKLNELLGGGRGACLVCVGGCTAACVCVCHESRK